jgi:predicted chitinase
MEQDAIQQILNAAYSQYPWAGEETALELAKLSRSSSIKTTALAVAIARLQGATDADALTSHIKNLQQNLDKSLADGRRRIKTTEGNARAMGRATMSKSSSGLESMIELAGAGAKAMDNAAEGLASVGGKVGKVASGFSWATGGAVALTGVGAVMAKLITTQEKEVRAMINMGLTLARTNDYTDLRLSAANLGMSLGDYGGMIQNHGELVVGLGDNVAEGQGVMFDFLNDKERVKHVKNFGYSPKILSALLAEETEQLYKLNQVNELNSTGQNKVIKSFQTANNMGIYLADTLGVQRGAMMEARKMIREDQDFILAMNQNTAYMNEKYGEGTALRATETADFFAQIGTATLGEELTKQLLDVFTGTTSDIQFDESAVNNIMNEQLTATLQMLGPGTFEGFMKFIEDGVTGELKDPAERTVRFQQLLKLIKNSPTLIGVDPNSVAVNQLIASMNILPEAFLNGTKAEIDAKLNSAQEGIDGADDAIEIVGGLSKAFLRAQHAFTPGFETMGTVMGVLESSIGTFADFWRDMFGLDHTAAASMETTLQAGQQDDVRGSQVFNTATGGMSVGGSGQIDVTTVVGYNDESQTAAMQELRSTAMKEMGSLMTMFKEDQTRQLDLMFDIQRVGLTDLVDDVEKYTAAIEKQKLKGRDTGPLELELLNAQKKLDEANLIAGPMQLEMGRIKDRMANAQDYMIRLRSIVGTSATPRKRSDMDMYAQGSTLQGIVLKQLAEQGITDPRAQANILGMIQGESAFKMVSEQSYANTSNERIRAKMGRRVSGLNDAQLDDLKKDPKKFFDYVYSDLGGYDYRGRGFIQLTGKENYKLVGEMIGEDLVGNPDLMLNPQIAAAASAAYFNLPWWKKYKSDLGNMDTVYRVVYGATASSSGRMGDLNTRTGYANQFMQAMNTGELSAATEVGPEIQQLQSQITDITDIENNDIPLTVTQQSQLVELEAKLAAEMLRLQLEMSGETNG